MTLSRLTELLVERGRTTKATAKQAAKPVRRSHVHKMLSNRYYLGLFTYKGVEYPGNTNP